MPEQIADRHNPSRQLKVNLDGSTNVRDFLIEVNKGNVPGHIMVHKFASNDNVGTTPEDIWATGGTLTFQTIASVYDVTSDSANDNNATGSGARKLFILGLDSNFNEISETINLTGATIVSTSNSYIRLTRVYVTDCGTYGGTNEGSIIIRVTGAGAIQATIEAGEGQTEKSHYTVPTGKTAYFIKASLSVESNKTAEVKVWQRQNADDVTVPFTGKRIVHEWDGVTGVVVENFHANHIFPEKTDIWFTGVVPATNAIVETDYDMLLIDN